MERWEEQARNTGRTPWGAILGGAVVAIGGGWLGELFGGSVSLGGGGTGTAWLAGILSLGLLAVGALVGGWVASRLSNPAGRGRGALNGLVVWGALATFSAFNFALLGGNIALVAGDAAGAVQVAFGMTTLGLVLALPAALIGGSVGAIAERRAEAAAGRERERGAGVAGREREVFVERRPGAGEALPEGRRESYIAGRSYPERGPEEPRPEDRGGRGPTVH
jgi:hypothetical protein